ncbi:MAG: hypothetical protein IID41_10490 [Planctomycetes bacterium]|nr:hypothetical protein [Planctomycetota bacterium]
MLAPDVDLNLDIVWFAEADELSLPIWVVFDSRRPHLEPFKHFERGFQLSVSGYGESNVIEPNAAFIEPIAWYRLSGCSLLAEQFLNHDCR